MSPRDGDRKNLPAAAKDAESTFSGAPVGQPAQPCPTPHLVQLTVVSGAAQIPAPDDKTRGMVEDTWAAIVSDSAEVIVEARTDPNTEATWKQIVWGGDEGDPVPGRPNQRSVSRSVSHHWHIDATLGGVLLSVDLWIVSATISILTEGELPERAQPFYDEDTDKDPKHKLKLGVVGFDDWRRARGRIVAVVSVSPPGVGNAVPIGWNICRLMQGWMWKDGRPDLGTPPRFFSAPNWYNDTSTAELKTLDPGNEDKIYDSDAPNIEGVDAVDRRTIISNFRQWAEWNGKDKQSGGVCSATADWHFEGIWKSSPRSRVVDAEVDKGHVAPPSKEPEELPGHERKGKGK